MVLVFSSGRSGTNLVLEMFTDHSMLTPSQYPEDKLLFKRDIMYPHTYLTKCDVVYVNGYDEFKRFMLKNKHCKVIWTVRHPFDWAMSKIYRGWGHAEDATIHGCLDDLDYMYNLLQNVTGDFENRIIVTKMEKVLLDIESQAKLLCKFTKLPFEKSMLTPYKRMRHIGKRNRYKMLDKSQIDLYKNWKSCYNGFFIKESIDLEYVFDNLMYLVNYLQYEV